MTSRRITKSACLFLTRTTRTTRRKIKEKIKRKKNKRDDNDNHNRRSSRFFRPVEKVDAMEESPTDYPSIAPSYSPSNLLSDVDEPSASITKEKSALQATAVL